MQLERLGHQSVRFSKHVLRSFQSIHGWIMACGIFTEALHLTVLLATLIKLSLGGNSALFVNLAMVYLALKALWQQREQILQLHSISDERFVGYVFIVAGTLIFGAYHSSVVPRVFACGVVLVGLLCSCWGFTFLRRYWFAILLLLVSLHPNLERVTRLLWEAFTPPNFLSKLMAWSGSLLLQAIGQSAFSQEQFLILPTGRVEVASGCDGFAMAYTMLVAGFILGLLFQQRKIVIMLLMLAGILLALLFNVPRIGLMTYAAVYWGKDVFNFWHGTIGGQIFSGVLFTVYYYLFMSVVNSDARRVQS